MILKSGLNNMLQNKASTTLIINIVISSSHGRDKPY